ncbi:MAG: hypothetical protein FWE13_03490 [Firmicutes bacterium]|nr:hypothetical protein [Bacillota bacterium]
MKNIKKISILLVVLLAIIISIPLIACSDCNNYESSSSDTSTDTTTSCDISSPITPRVTDVRVYRNDVIVEVGFSISLADGPITLAVVVEGEGDFDDSIEIISAVEGIASFSSRTALGEVTLTPLNTGASLIIISSVMNAAESQGFVLTITT